MPSLNLLREHTKQHPPQLLLKWLQYLLESVRVPTYLLTYLPTYSTTPPISPEQTKSCNGEFWRFLLDGCMDCTFWLDSCLSEEIRSEAPIFFLWVELTFTNFYFAFDFWFLIFLIFLVYYKVMSELIKIATCTELSLLSLFWFWIMEYCLLLAILLNLCLAFFSNPICQIVIWIFCQVDFGYLPTPLRQIVKSTLPSCQSPFCHFPTHQLLFVSYLAILSNCQVHFTLWMVLGVFYLLHVDILIIISILGKLACN